MICITVVHYRYIHIGSSGVGKDFNTVHSVHILNNHSILSELFLMGHYFNIISSIRWQNNWCTGVYSQDITTLETPSSKNFMNFTCEIQLSDQKSSKIGKKKK